MSHTQALASSQKSALVCVALSVENTDAVGERHSIGVMLAVWICGLCFIAKRSYTQAHGCRICPRLCVDGTWREMRRSGQFSCTYCRKSLLHLEGLCPLALSEERRETLGSKLPMLQVCTFMLRSWNLLSIMSPVWAEFGAWMLLALDANQQTWK